MPSFSTVAFVHLVDAAAVISIVADMHVLIPSHGPAEITPCKECRLFNIGDVRRRQIEEGALHGEGPLAASEMKIAHRRCKGHQIEAAAAKAPQDKT